MILFVAMENICGGIFDAQAGNPLYTPDPFLEYTFRLFSKNFSKSRLHSNLVHTLRVLIVWISSSSVSPEAYPITVRKKLDGMFHSMAVR